MVSIGEDWNMCDINTRLVETYGITKPKF